MSNPNFHDVEQLSALLDGKLSPAEAAKLEARLKSDPNLKSILEDLTETRSLLRRMPRRKAPRNFTLTPQMAGVKPPVPRSVPTLRFATLLATFLLVFSLATNALVPALQRTASAPAYGMGGGGGGADPTMEAQLLAEAGIATEAPAATLLPPAAAEPLNPQSTLIPTLSAEEQARLYPTPTPEPSLKDTGPAAEPFAQSAPAQEPQPEAAPGPVPLPWLVGLLGIALLCGGAAWAIRSASERAWRAKTK